MSLNATATTSTTITIQWGAVPCMDQNSEITGYKVRYGPVGSSQRATDAVTGSASTGGMYTLTGLIPFTNYSIEVAAVNSNGDIGPFTLPVVDSTVHIESCKLNCFTVIYSSYYYIGNGNKVYRPIVVAVYCASSVAIKITFLSHLEVIISKEAFLVVLAIIVLHA